MVKYRYAEPGGNRTSEPKEISDRKRGRVKSIELAIQFISAEDLGMPSDIELADMGMGSYKQLEKVQGFYFVEPFNSLLNWKRKEKRNPFTFRIEHTPGDKKKVYLRRGDGFRSSIYSSEQRAALISILNYLQSLKKEHPKEGISFHSDIYFQKYEYARLLWRLGIATCNRSPGLIRLLEQNGKSSSIGEIDEIYKRNRSIWIQSENDQKEKWWDIYKTAMTLDPEDAIILFGFNSQIDEWHKEFELEIRSVWPKVFLPKKEAEKSESTSSAKPFEADNQKRIEPPVVKMRINTGDFLVRSSIFQCMRRNHHVQDIEAELAVLNRNGDIVIERISAGYCQDCQLFFILEPTLELLLQKGRPLCQIIEYEKYRKNYQWYEFGERDLHWNEESVLRMCGYSVSSTEGLSARQRQKILANMIDQKVITKQGIISYLNSFIKLRENNTRFERAISKWNEDIAFVNGYRVGDYTRYGIAAVFRPK